MFIIGVLSSDASLLLVDISKKLIRLSWSLFLTKTLMANDFL